MTPTAKGRPTSRALTAALLATALYAFGTENPESELSAVVERLNALDTWLDEAGQRLARRQREIAESDRQIAETTRGIRDLDPRIAETEAQLAQLREERERLDEARKRHARRVAAHLQDAWRISEADTLKMLLNLEDPVLLERLGRYHAYFAKARSEVVDDLGATVAAVRRNQAELRERQSTLESSRAMLTESRLALVADRSSRSRLIADLKSDMDAKNSEQERLDASRRRLESLIAELDLGTVEEAEPPDPPRADPGRAGLPMAATRKRGIGTKGDVPWPVDGRVEHRFGDIRTGGRTRWQGVYFGAALGAEVRSIGPGRVAFADWLRGFGLLAIVDHGNARMSLYGAADALYVRSGDWVDRGDAIATVGQSGGHTEVGLYFEIREDGEPTDPLAWLKPIRSRR